MSRRPENDRSDRSDRPERRADRGEKRYADPPPRDYGRDPRDARDPYAEKPSRDPPRENRAGRDLNEYFVDGQGISRAVLQMDICKYLGPEATSRPGTYHVRSTIEKPGFFVKAVRAFTPEQLDDLRASSRLYSSEAREIRSRGYEGIPSTESSLMSRPNPYSEPPYEHSQTRRRMESTGGMPAGDSYYPSPGPSAIATPYGAGPSVGYTATATTFASPSGYPAFTMTPASGSVPAGTYPPMAGESRYPGYVYDTPMQPGLQGGYQEYYPQGSGLESQRRRDPAPSGYAYTSSGQDPRFVDDRSQPAGYGYDPSYPPAPSGEDSHLNMIQSQAEILMVDVQDLPKILTQGNVEGSRGDAINATMPSLLESAPLDTSTAWNSDGQSFFRTDVAVCTYRDHHTLIGLIRGIISGGGVLRQIRIQLAITETVFSNMGFSRKNMLPSRRFPPHVSPCSVA
ncbi:hypothetical protein MMC11_008311 [Xylographa trunciseda]|nr:hypothetical protein [Xylographa trunciseda]